MSIGSQGSGSALGEVAVGGQVLKWEAVLGPAGWPSPLRQLLVPWVTLAQDWNKSEEDFSWEFARD